MPPPIFLRLVQLMLVPCCIQHIRDILILPPPISLLYSAHSGHSHFNSSHFLAVFSTFGTFSFYLIPFYLLPFYLLPFYLLPLVPCCIQHIRDILILPPPIFLRLVQLMLVPCCIQHIRDILILPPPISLLYSAHSGHSHFTSSHFLAVFSTFGTFSFYLLPFPCCIQHIRDILILPHPILPPPISSVLYLAHSGYSHFTSSHFLAVFSTFGTFSFYLLPLRLVQLMLVPCCIQHIRDILILHPPISLLYSAHSGHSHFTSSHFTSSH